MKALKIKLALLLLLFTGMVNAQIVNIPDANFKAKLLSADITNQIASSNNYIIGVTPFQYMKIDTNNDGEIQYSEAELVKYLDVYNSNITNLNGISFFPNLEFLNCGYNQLINLDISQNLGLIKLYCNSNQLNFLSVSQNINLVSLSCAINQLTNLDLSQNLNLTELYCYNNQFTGLDFSQNVNLNILWCAYNQISNLNISQNVNLVDLYCSNNLISNLNTINNINLESLNCSGNLLTVLNVSQNLNLKSLHFDFNQLTNINLFQNSNLKSLWCYNNQLTNLNLLQNLMLNDLLCYNNQLTNLDVSQNAILNTLYCSNNQLTSLFIKNGKIETNLSFSNNPNLQYICADDAQLTDVQTKINTYGYTSTCSVSSYCSFTPGGNYNTISGNIKFDSDNNGCDANDLAQPNIRVNINDGINTGASFTSTTGDYKFYTQAGSFDITPEIENPTFFNFTPSTATIPFADNNNNTATQDFCISANGFHPDLEVVLASIAPARPGFDATYKLVYRNKGNQMLSGSVNLVFDDAKTDFVSANPIVDNLAVNSLTWNYNNLLPFESRSIDVVLNVNSPLETPAVNIGDVLNFTANINPISGDELPDDNTFDYNQTVVGSYDPNDITCLEGNSVAPSEIGEYLHYVINFENTGNYPAENVVVKTIVDATKFDIDSLQLLNTSNPVDARITGNVVEFIFENIQLGGPGGHGHILLKIKSKNTLVSGDAVAKNANIYFDYNAPVDTGMVTTVFQSLSNAVFEKDDSINVSPNPTSGTININCNNNVKKIELYDVQGRILETQIGETKALDISEKTNGIYFLKITTEKGSKVEKVIKE